jgi:hypothetical protein
MERHRVSLGQKKGEEEIIDISSPPFLVLQKDNTKTRT